MQMAELLLAIIRLDQVLEQVQLNLNQPVAEKELVVARELLDLREEPLDEIVSFGEHILLGGQVRPSKKFLVGLRPISANLRRLAPDQA